MYSNKELNREAYIKRRKSRRHKKFVYTRYLGDKLQQKYDQEGYDYCIYHFRACEYKYKRLTMSELIKIKHSQKSCYSEPHENKNRVNYNIRRHRKKRKQSRAKITI